MSHKKQKVETISRIRTLELLFITFLSILLSGIFLLLFDQVINGTFDPLRFTAIFLIVAAFFINSTFIIFFLKNAKARRTVEDGMKVSDVQYRLLVENAPDFIFRIDKKGVIKFLNRAFPGNTKDEMLGKSIFNWVSPSCRKKYKQVTDRVVRTNTPSAMQCQIINESWLDNRYIPISNNGKVGSIMVISADITHIKRSEKRIDELNELRNRFIEIVSHQLRTPLNAIRWNLETLMAEELGSLKKEQRELLRVTHDANLEVIDRIHDLLTVMDIREGRVAFAKDKISLERLWESVLGGWKNTCKIRQLKCSYKAPEEQLPMVLVDSQKIRFVMKKLLDNATSYTPARGLNNVKITHSDGVIRFEISDTGIGIPKSEQKRIFFTFFRASNAPTMKADASGLGLTIAKYFVEQHGGKIGFKSEDEVGSTFWFEIPIA